MSYGLLSGVAIAEAVKRQYKYKQLSNRSQPYGGKHLSLIEQLQMRWLKHQPRIHIDNFDSRPSDLGGTLNPNSYNLTLAPSLLVYDVPLVPQELRLARDHDEEVWQRYILDSRKNNPTRQVTIPADGYTLKPGRLYLGKTVEYTETYNLVPVLDGRSSIGRLGMAIHVTAGFGDNFWKGHWTLEIFVIQPVKIYPNQRVAQVRYHTTGKGRPYAGKYNNLPGTPAEASKIWQEFVPA